MIVALARKLLIVLWRLAATGEMPAGLLLTTGLLHSNDKELARQATILALRVPPRASAVHLRYHALSGLLFWCTR